MKSDCLQLAGMRLIASFVGCQSRIEFVGRRKLDEHIVAIDSNRENIDAKILAAYALAGFERECFFVQGTGDFWNAVLIAEEST